MAKEKLSIEQERIERMKRLCEKINKGNYGGENHDAITFIGNNSYGIAERFSSGCKAFDYAFGGGVPKGKIIELFGAESAGKSTLVYHIIANHQKAYPDEDIALFDTEFSFDTGYASALGVDVSTMLVSQPESGIQALNIAKSLVEEEDSNVKLIIIDSIAALTTRSDDEGNIGDQTMAEQARMISQAMRVLNAQCGRKGVTLIVTNQVREAVGIMYGEKQTTPAGKALKHYAHIRAKLTKLKQIKQGEISIGVESRLDCVKNKVAPPFRRAEYTLTFGLGIDAVLGVVDLAITQGVISKKAAWFSFEGEQLANGKPNLVEMLRKDLSLYNRIENKLNEELNNAKILDPNTSDPEKEVESQVESV
jgi:recombination protein RecA